LSIEDYDEDPWNITIPELEGERVIPGNLLHTVDVNKPLKLKEVNVGTKEQPKMTNIGDYWDDDMVGKIAELLTKYQYLIPQKFL